MKDLKDTQTIDAFPTKSSKPGRPRTTKTEAQKKADNAARQAKFRAKGSATKNAIAFALKAVKSAQKNDDLPYKSAANSFLFFLHGTQESEVVNVTFSESERETNKELDFPALVELVNKPGCVIERFY